MSDSNGAAAPTPPPDAPPSRQQQLLQRALVDWGGADDLWIFGYASLIWRPEFAFSESRLATVHGWHRALRMWSRVNRGTPEVPGLVFALLSGGSCRGVAYRVPHADGAEVLARMWLREMVTGVYEPRWLPCRTSVGTVRALAFTLSRRSPSYTGALELDQYRAIFGSASGRFGSTLDYAMETSRCLAAHGIADHTLHRLMRDYGAMKQAAANADAASRHERERLDPGATDPIRSQAGLTVAQNAVFESQPKEPIP